MEPTGRATPNFARPDNEVVATGYWLSTNSNKRHRKSCRWYENSKGRYCTATEGTAAGCCH